MAPILRTVVTALLAAAAVAALAQEPDQDKNKEPAITKVVIGERAPELVAESWFNYDGTPTLDRFKNRIVILFFFQTTDKSAEAIPTLNQAYKKFGPQGVVVIGLTPQKREGAENVLRDKDLKFIVGFAVKTEERYQVASFPTVYLIDTAGKLVNRFNPAEELEEKLQAQIAKTPPIGSDSQTLRNRLDQAATAARNREYGKAYTLAKDVSKTADKESDSGKRAAELLKQVEESAKKWLEDAKDAAKAEEYDKACRILAELSVHFTGESIGADADTEIGRLMGDSKLKPKLRKALDNAKGQVLIDQAADHEASRRYLDALKLYRAVAEQYPETDASKTAEAALTRIKDDPKAQETVKTLRDEEEAARWLDLADRFAKVEMYAKAREFYQRVIDSHPTARAASKAKERLAKLPEEKPEEEPELPAGEEEGDTAE